MMMDLQAIKNRVETLRSDLCYAWETRNNLGGCRLLNATEYVDSIDPENMILLKALLKFSKKNYSVCGLASDLRKNKEELTFLN